MKLDLRVDDEPISQLRKVGIKTGDILYQFDDRCALMESTLKGLSEVVDVIVNLDHVITSLETHQLTQEVFDLIDVDGELTALLGITAPVITDETREELTTASIESLSDSAKKAWHAIVQFFKDMARQLKDFLTGILDTAVVLAARCGREIRRLSKIKIANDFADIKVPFYDEPAYGVLQRLITAMTEIDELYKQTLDAKTVDDVRAYMSTANETMVGVRLTKIDNYPISWIGIKTVGDIVDVLHTCIKVLVLAQQYKAAVKITQRKLDEGLKIAHAELKKTATTTEERLEARQAMLLLSEQLRMTASTLMLNAKSCNMLTMRVLFIASKIQEA